MTTSITIKYRRLDENGDYCFGKGLGDFISEAEAVSQAIQTKLKLYEGEWWEDIKDGLPMFQKILGQRTPKSEVTNIIKNRILELKDYILELKDVSFDYNQITRAYSFACTIITIYGQAIILNIPIPTGVQ